MEDEADLGDNQLKSQISTRRRSASVSDDYSVQKTNDDATESKFAAVKVGYWTDPYLQFFVNHPSTLHRRTPEIMRGYWARHLVFELLLKKAFDIAGRRLQIINLGAGFDTIFFRLKEKGVEFSKLVEIDFSSVTAKKIKIISKSPELAQFFQYPIKEDQHSDLLTPDYCLLGADLRQYKEFWNKLQTAELDSNLPTIVLSECVLIYMDYNRCDEMLSSIAKHFKNCAFINYEQVNMDDKFSSVMRSNLLERGVHLPGTPACQSLNTQKRRFETAGFSRVEAWTMQNLYASHFNADEVKRIESLEHLDERELLSQLLEHYCIVIAVKAESDLFSGLF